MAAALALYPTRSWLAALRAPVAHIAFAASFVPSFLAAPRPFSWAIPSLPSLLELMPPWLLAVPKKKTSHSRKAMRSANKGLKDKQNLVHCESCGSPKLAHNLCPKCYRELNIGWKAKNRS
ncbi:hypothetical protein BD414DRAFT_384740, partial [Trametes punicea]